MSYPFNASRQGVFSEKDLEMMFGNSDWPQAYSDVPNNVYQSYNMRSNTITGSASGGGSGNNNLGPVRGGEDPDKYFNPDGTPKRTVKKTKLEKEEEKKDKIVRDETIEED